VGPAEASAFKAAVEESGLRSVLAHGSYLVNLASPYKRVLARSRNAFVAEMNRCAALGIRHLILHPGAHMGSGEEAGLAAVAASLDHALERCAGLGVRPVLEVTAGQGSYLGHRFEHLRAILDRMQRPGRVGVCLDTCHLFAAGYDIATEKGHERTVREFDRVVGLGKLEAMHLNDARRGLGSRLDRHEAIGAGCLGLEAFRRILNDPRLNDVPMILETPGGASRWKKEIALLRSLRGRA
jgi:deoxyribonuclease-4